MLARKCKAFLSQCRASVGFCEIRSCDFGGDSAHIVMDECENAL